MYKFGSGGNSVNPDLVAASEDIIQNAVEWIEN